MVKGDLPDPPKAKFPTPIVGRLDLYEEKME